MKAELAKDTAHFINHLCNVRLFEPHFYNSYFQQNKIKRIKIKCSKILYYNA